MIQQFIVSERPLVTKKTSFGREPPASAGVALAGGSRLNGGRFELASCAGSAHSEESFLLLHWHKPQKTAVFCRTIAANARALPSGHAVCTPNVSSKASGHSRTSHNQRL